MRNFFYEYYPNQSNECCDENGGDDGTVSKMVQELLDSRAHPSQQVQPKLSSNHPRNVYRVVMKRKQHRQEQGL
jgi:hypothetical protein